MTESPEAPRLAEPRMLDPDAPEHQTVSAIANSLLGVATMFGEGLTVTAVSVFLAETLLHADDALVDEALRRFDVMVRANRESARGAMQKQAN